MAHTGLIADEQLHTLALISRLPCLEDFYLAGGTAAAFHLGHRFSLDYVRHAKEALP